MIPSLYLNLILDVQKKIPKHAAILLNSMSKVRPNFQSQKKPPNFIICKVVKTEMKFLVRQYLQTLKLYATIKKIMF